MTTRIWIVRIIEAFAKSLALLPWRTYFNRLKRFSPKSQSVNLGSEYDTTWARKTVPSHFRNVFVTTILRAIVFGVTKPVIKNLDHLDGLKGPVIFAANHSSHLDASLLLVSLPKRFRNRCIIAAGADYWFDTKWKSRAAALLMNIIPIDRSKVGRKSTNLAFELLSSGWNVLIFPEGTRSRSGFMSPFQKGAAFLAMKCNVAVIPVYLEGTRPVFGVGSRKVHPGPTSVTFGPPMFSLPGERYGSFSNRIEAGVERCADENNSDWWTSIRNVVAGQTPSLKAPTGLTGWRLYWEGSKLSNSNR